MSDKIFFDTNTLIYLYSSDELSKKATIERVIYSSQNSIISSQVINELVNVLYKKKHASVNQLGAVISELESQFLIVNLSVRTIKNSLKIVETYKYSYFDSLMVASALEHACMILYTEDMHHGHIIDNSLRIVNPFIGTRVQDK